MIINPHRLAVLLAVAREGGIVAAADVLGVSPSAVSQQIQRLEDEVGVDVIERTPAGAVLTPAGRVLSASAERIETELSEAGRNLRPLTGQVTGEVSIGSVPTVIRNVLIPFANDLAQALPGIDVQLHESDEIPGMVDLRAGRLDLLTLERDISDKQAPRGFSDTLFFGEPWVLVTPDADASISSPTDLARLRWLRTTPGTAGARATERILSALPAPLMSPDSYVNYDVALALVRAGRGSTVLPRLALTGHPPEGVRAIPLPDLGVRHLFLRYRDRAAGPGTPTGRTMALLLQWVIDHHLTGATAL